MIDERLCRRVAEREISRVCHFTQSRKLPHILSSAAGILSVARLKKDNADVLDQNDAARLDRKLTHINCSIEYPNTWMLKKVKDRERFFRDWVVLLINPNVLTYSTTFFAPRNAAACVDRHATGIAGFDALYANSIVGAYGRTFTRSAKMLAACPTDDQAEALIDGSIPRSLITGIAVSSEEQARLERARFALLPDIPANLTWVVAPALFDGTWSSMVRNGARPVERVLTETP